MAERGHDKLRHAVEKLPTVRAIPEIRIEDGMVSFLRIETRTVGAVMVRRVEVRDAPQLFEFYTEGLSEKPRHLFAPYPLFHSPPGSAEELAGRIADWKQEKDWTAVHILKDGKTIGFCMLKRFHTENVTSGIAVRDDFAKKGMGGILQTIIIEQARLLNLKRFHVKIVSDNWASVKLHEKCGFKRTRILPPPIYEDILQYLNKIDGENGVAAVDRHIIEMIIDL